MGLHHDQSFTTSEPAELIFFYKIMYMQSDYNKYGW